MIQFIEVQCPVGIIGNQNIFDYILKKSSLLTHINETVLKRLNIEHLNRKVS